ncbi:hypothetical protein RND71_021516 [Anisodus tanguticus]|uniref:F-box associated beta-propeller type 3 domain-containing protein n=1 Tax=Anisodus tanguticus TaxID=243964 RepID=A0AAE1V8B5_9SOLA|nr:hypothetical protein RND71_021516 [Anisodus tanguticus]
MGDEIDDIEFAQQMLSLKERHNKYGEDKSRGMKQVEKSHQKIITLSNYPESIIFNILVKIPPRYIFKECHAIPPRRGDGKLQVINPATKFWFTIPKCPSGCLHEACCAALAFDSSTKQYKVIHVITDSYGFEIFNLSCADEHWERVSGPWEDLKSPVSINGRLLHWCVDSSEYFISMEVKEAKFRRTSLPTHGEVINKTKNYALSDTQMDVWILEHFRGKVWSKKHMIVAELTNYICPYICKSTRQNERTMPKLGKLVVVAGARNGEVLILQHKKNSSLYIYDTKSMVMKTFNDSSNMRNLVSFIPHKDNLF